MVVYLEGSFTSTTHQIQLRIHSGLFTFRRLNGPLKDLSAHLACIHQLVLIFKSYGSRFINHLTDQRHPRGHRLAAKKGPHRLLSWQYLDFLSKCPPPSEFSLVKSVRCVVVWCKHDFSSSLTRRSHKGCGGVTSVAIRWDFLFILFQIKVNQPHLCTPGSGWG